MEVIFFQATELLLYCSQHPLFFFTICISSWAMKTIFLSEFEPQCRNENYPCKNTQFYIQFGSNRIKCKSRHVVKIKTPFTLFSCSAWLWSCGCGQTRQGPLKKWREHSLNLHILKIHSRGAPITPCGWMWVDFLDHDLL